MLRVDGAGGGGCLGNGRGATTRDCNRYRPHEFAAHWIRSHCSHFANRFPRRETRCTNRSLGRPAALAFQTTT